jgi:hypothetical protein
VSSLSESSFSSDSDADDVDCGGERCCIVRTLATALRVRRIGLSLSSLFFVSCSWFSGGSVRAQFSHGLARALSASVYVFRKEESRISGNGADCSRGDSGGVSAIADEDVCDALRLDLSKSADDEESVRLEALGVG